MANYPSSASSDSNLFVAKNNLSTSLSSGIDNAVTSIPVVSTTGFPTVGFISIDLEIISYTSVDATHFLGATRAAEGSSATSHASGAGVSHNVVAAHHNASKDEIIAIETDLVAVQSALTPVAAASTATSILNRINQIVQRFKDMTGLTNWYDAFTSFPVTKGGTGNTSLTSGAYLKGAGASAITTQSPPIPVSDGGTGDTTLTSGAYLKGAGTSAVTVQSPPIPVSDGGTGATTLSSGAYLKGAGTSAITTQATPIPVADGGTGATSLTSGAYLKGAGTSAVTTQATPIPIADGGTNSATALGNNKIIRSTSGALVESAIGVSSAKLTGLDAGTANGDSVRFEQIFYGFQAPVQATTTTSTSTTSSTFTDSALTASITPTSSSHRIKVSVSGSLQVAAGATACEVTIKRGSTNLGGTDGFTVLLNSGVATRAPGAITYIDSPATTSSTTYTVQLRSTDNATAVRFPSQTGDTAVIILEEIV